MDTREILMGTIGRPFNDGRAKSITFCVTEECNLRCSYCYMTGKNSFHRMSLDVAKQAVDYFLGQEPEEEAVIWEFIGGEPLLEIDLIDQISDYIKQQMYLRNHPWFKNYIFSIGSNGVLYNDSRVQAYLKKNAAHVSVAITIDGTREKHDMNRVFHDGSGSYDSIIDNVLLWKKQFPNAETKVTFASDDLKFLKDSIIHLWNLGLEIIPANVVFEDVWKDGDTEIYRQQLLSLADYILENKLWYNHSVRFFDPHVGHPMGKHAKSQPFCGTGRMRAVDCNGNLYPCIRFLDFCMPEKPVMSIGDICGGINTTKQKQFSALSIGLVNDEECNQCQVSSGCFSCTGCNYEYSPTNSIFNRTKFHCELQKIQVECNEYFWTEVAKRTHSVTPFERARANAYRSENWKIEGAGYLYFLLSDNSPAYCMYSTKTGMTSMTKDLLRKGLQYAHDHHMIPIFLGNPYNIIDEVEKYRTHVVIDYFSYLEQAVSDVVTCIPVITRDDDISLLPDKKYSSVIYSLSLGAVSGLSDRLIELAYKVDRINIMKQDLVAWTSQDAEEYASELDVYHRKASSMHINNSLNIIDSQSKSQQNHCLAGRSEFTLAPNGFFYACPAFYYNFPDQKLGDISTGINVTERSLYLIEKAIPCKECTNSSCMRCLYANYTLTSTINVAADIQCLVAEKEEML